MNGNALRHVFLNAINKSFIIKVDHMYHVVSLDLNDDILFILFYNKMSGLA